MAEIQTMDEYSCLPANASEMRERELEMFAEGFRRAVPMDALSAHKVADWWASLCGDNRLGVPMRVMPYITPGPHPSAFSMES